MTKGPRRGPSSTVQRVRIATVTSDYYASGMIPSLTGVRWDSVVLPRFAHHRGNDTQ